MALFDLTVGHVAVALLATVALLLWKARNIGRKPDGMPPGPPTLPLVGNIHQMPASSAHLQFRKWADEYGPIFSLMLGTQPVVVLSSDVVVKDLLEKRGQIYSDRPETFLSQTVASGDLRLVVMRYGENWRLIHKLVHNVLNISIAAKYIPYQDLENKYLLRDLALASLVSLLVLGIYYLAGRLGRGNSPFSLGFGAVDSRALISAPGLNSLAGGILLANLPQLVCSVLYFAYNALLTCMLLCYEYSRYASRTGYKPLRVTHSRGKQRSTYFLHLPYTYSLPLIAVSAILHWVISQSIFLVQVNGQSHPGISCQAILCTIIIGALMMIVALSLGSRKFGSNIPVARSCSAVLSAVCHPPEADVDAAYLPVGWGAVATNDDGDIGHCCFTSQEVHRPIHGRMYASSSSAS